jgi:hypothetical protein
LLSRAQNEKKNRDNPMVFEHLYRGKETLEQQQGFPAKQPTLEQSKHLQKPKVIGPSLSGKSTAP